VQPAILPDFGYVVEANGFRVLDVDVTSAVRAETLPGPHRDPFDGLIAAQAIALAAAVVTNHAAFTELGVDVFW